MFTKKSIQSAFFLSSLLLASTSFAIGIDGQIPEPLKPYDWSQVLAIPPGTGINEGSQIMHFKSRNKPFEGNPEAKKFVERHLAKAKQLHSDAEVLRFASDAVKLSGAFIEMGVCTGKTINFLAALNPHQTIYGFDSFEGLPEDWVRQDRTFGKGTFAFKEGQSLPPVLHNVKLYKGVFKDVLPAFKESVLQQKPIALLHMDADLYSSTRDVFDTLGDLIVPGTVIVFDEFYNYPGSEEHEWKALQEFLAKNKTLDVEFLAFNANHEQVAVRLVEKANEINNE